MSGNPASGRGDASGPGDAEAPAKEIQILETLRAMRQLVTFSPDDLPEAFANHFSLGQVAEMAARLEDARLVMEADQPPAGPAPGSGPQRLWLAGGRAASPQRKLEFRALTGYRLDRLHPGGGRRYGSRYEAVANQAPCR